jgi:hypothetical protein
LGRVPYDANATRERLLAAAIEEFSEWGFAGGRVGRRFANGAEELGGAE